MQSAVGLGQRVGRLRLRWHAVALAVALLAWTPIVGLDGLFVSDEGAVRAQVELVSNRGEWTLPNPAPALDPRQEALPISNASGTVDGRWAPYAKQPGYVAAVVGAEALIGDGAWVALGVAGTVVAAVAAALLVRRARPGAEVLALWATGFLSPLSFDAQLTMAHAPVAGVAGASALLAFAVRGSRRARAMGIAASALVTALGATLRAEAVLLGLALAFGLLFTARPKIERVLGAALVAAAAFAGRLANGWLVRRALGGDASPDLFTTGVASEGFIADRLSGARTSLLGTGYGDASLLTEAVLLGTVVAVATVVVARRRPDDPAVRLLGVAAGALVIVRLGAGPGAIPGLLVACPFLLVGWLALDRHDLRRPLVAPLVATSLAFGAAVVATQYSIGGGVEWGGRYFAAGVPLVGAVATVGIAGIADRLPARSRLVLGPSLFVASLALVAVGVVTLREAHSRSERLVDIVSAASTDIRSAGEAATVVSTTDVAGRAAWRPSTEVSWFTTDGVGLRRLGARLLQAEVGSLILVSRAVDGDLAVLGPMWRRGETLGRVEGVSVVSVAAAAS